ncbi:cytochrome P450 [Streptomyces hygroscopicus]|uniref:cytochrome P450 n=1 Tax=Streptomyces hygroscopicus TaxID=1912 RepID=UPI00362F9A03
MPIARNLTSKDLYDNPYPIYRELRDHEPWAWSDALGLWLVSRYEDVLFVDQHPEIFTAHQDNSLAERAMGLVMVRTDGDAHRRLRTAMDGPLKRRNVRERWSEGLKSHATELVGRLAEKPEFDLVTEFAAPFAAQALTRAVGLPGVTTEQVVEWSGAFIAGLANHDNDPVVWERCDRASTEVENRVRETIDRVTAEPDGTVISAMVHADLAEPLTVEEITTQVRLILSGGFNEPWDALATLVWHLCEQPELRDRVLADPAALDAAIEETARWLTPTGAFPRQLAVDYAVGGVTLRAGDKLLALASSGNRDERKFADPDVFDIDRPNLQDHLGFSLGAHYCLGVYLAREQMRTAVPALFNSLAGLRVARAPKLVGWMFCGLQSLDMAHDTQGAKGAAQ